MSTIAPAAGPPARSEASPDVPTLPIYRLSVEQYEAMARHGILDTRDRIELLHGWLVPKMTKNPPHTIATGLVNDSLTVHKPDGWHVRSQEPVTLADSVPEPDAALVRGERRAFAGSHPTPPHVGLLVEVAESTLDHDREVKRPMYAAARILVYWIVNRVDQQVEVYTDPSGPAAHPDYANRHDYRNGDDVPLIIDGTEVARIPVGELLP